LIEENRVENFNIKPHSEIQIEKKLISNFDIGNDNIDMDTVTSFGEEWSKFKDFSDADIQIAGDQYFDIVPEEIYKNKYILDVGCGTGRWSKYLARLASNIEAIDPSEAVFSAAALLQNEDNVRISRASVDNIPFEDNSFDFVFSLGVLHHIPDTQNAMEKSINKVKLGGYFLVYLYYALDNRGLIFKLLFNASNLLRRGISRLPPVAKRLVCDVLALFIYLPFIIFSKLIRMFGFSSFLNHVPLSYYADKSMNIIRNDSLDRFGTPLEQRFTKDEIRQMMVKSGLEEITFSEKAPFWHAIGKKI
jgi:SAM-dependent methyltransferase